MIHKGNFTLLWRLVPERLVADGTLTRQALLRLGLPWSPALVRRAFAVVGGTIGAAYTALRTGVAINLAGGTHHSCADHGEGYCIFNDFVIALRRLRAEGLARRFPIVDLDVHQGNGTAALCQADSDVFTFSVHSANNYPARKERSSWDIALPDGTGDEHYLDIPSRALPQLLTRFRPDLLFYQAGVDVLAGDRFGRLALMMDGVGQRDRLVCAFAYRTGLPLVITLGGGYARDLHRIVKAHCQTVRVAKAEHRGWHLPQLPSRSLSMACRSWMSVLGHCRQLFAYCQAHQKCTQLRVREAYRCLR